MKKSIKKLILMLISVSMFAVMPLTAFAGEDYTDVSTESYVTHLDDGSYYVTIFEKETDYQLMTSVKSIKKSTIYYSSDDIAQWKFILLGSFEFDGTTSKCTNSSVSVDIYKSKWYMSSKSASKSGNKATGNVTMKMKSSLGTVISTKTASLSITCDKNGNCS